ncbi:MAG TPA: helix-turn-helix transcriptional regulator [Methylovirgula sp.]
MTPVAEPLTLQAPIPPTERAPAKVSSDFEELLQHLDCGAIILDAESNVVAINDSAKENLGDGLSVIGNRLRVSPPNSQLDLDGLLCTVTLGADCDIQSLALRRPSGERPLILRAQLLADDRMHTRWTPRLLLVLLFAAERRVCEVPTQCLRALGLTRAEAEVAGLLGAGLSPHEVAERLNIKIATVRAHLKRIFQKLGIRRQTDLVQLVTRVSFVR